MVGCEKEDIFIPNISVYEIEYCKATVYDAYLQENNFYVLKNINGSIAISKSSIQLFLMSEPPVNKNLLLFNGEKFDVNNSDPVITSIILYGEYFLIKQIVGNIETVYYVYI